MDEEGEQRVRLFVGGLGPSITAAELERAFGSLGVVSGLEIVRSKDRDFAYLNFEAPSPAALRKVFSTYQGCKWKGGCLRVEKAREGYLSRLKREWELDAAARIKAGSRSADKKPAREPKPLQDLNIFFPRLRKTKTLRASGTGRHKRSFQRFDSLPLALLNLCGCEGHENEAVDPLNYEHESYLRLVDKLEEKELPKREKQKVVSPGTKSRRGGAEVKAPAIENPRMDIEESSEDEASDVEGVTLPGLKKRKRKTKESGSVWDNLFEAAAGLQDAQKDDGVGFEDRSPKQKRVKFPENLETEGERETVVEPENGPAEVMKNDQTSWAQISSWNDLVRGSALGRSDGAEASPGAAAGGAAGVVETLGTRLSGRVGVEDGGVEDGGGVKKKTPPSVQSLLGNETCSFMRSSNSEAEWV